MSWFAKLLARFKRPTPGRKPPVLHPVPPPSKPPYPRPPLKPFPWPTPTPIPMPTPVPPSGGSALIAELLARHNLERGSRQIGPLRVSIGLQTIAQQHATRMGVVGRLAHDGIGDGDLLNRTQGVGYPSWQVGENVASGYPDVDSVMRGWMSSDGHKANLLNPVFTECGLALADGLGASPYWCAVFGNPNASMADFVSTISMSPAAVQELGEVIGTEGEVKEIWEVEGGFLCAPWSSSIPR
jgi:uncharacterized protein YkwD